MAIIAILASLLLVGISGAKGKARRTVCTGNLRQINQGVRMYSDDSNDKSPKPAIGVSNPYNAYKELMKSYVGLRGQSSKQDKLFACPADTFYYDYSQPSHSRENPPVSSRFPEEFGRLSRNVI